MTTSAENWFISKPKHSYVMISPETRLMMLEITKPNVYALLNAALTSGRRVNGMQFRAIMQDVT